MVAVLILSIVPVNAVSLKRYPTDDAYVQGQNPTTNYGTEISLFVIDMGYPIIDQSYLKFTVTEFLDEPVVNFYFTTGVRDKITKIAIWVCSNNWLESSVTYDIRPSLITKVGDLWVSEEFTQYSINIKGYLSGDVISIAILPYFSDDVNDLVQICSKENSYEGFRPYISNNGNDNPYLVIGIVLGVIIGSITTVGVVYFYMKKRKEAESKVQQPPQFSGMTAPVLYCIQCGSKNVKMAKFCIACGATIE